MSRSFKAERTKRETVSIYAMIDPRDGKYFYVGASVSPKQRINGHISKPSNRTVKAVIDELLALGIKPTYTILETVPFSERVEKERRWIAKCYEDGHPLKNILGFDTFKGNLFFTMKILPSKTSTCTVAALVSGETKEFIDRLARESVARTSDVVRHLIELGIKHFSD